MPSSPQKAAKSSKVSFQKHSSKHVQAVMDKLHSELPNKLTKSSLTNRWVSKAKLSILRKISLRSKELFVTDDSNAAQLKEDIEQLKAKISRQTKIVQQHALSSIENSAYRPPAPVVTDTYKNAKFEEHAKLLSVKFQEIAKEMSAVSQSLESRTNSFGNSVATVHKSLDFILDTIGKKNGTIVSGTNNNGGSGVGRGGKAGATPRKESNAAAGGAGATGKQSGPGRRKNSPKGPAKKVFDVLDKA